MQGSAFEGCVEGEGKAHKPLEGTAQFFLGEKHVCGSTHLCRDGEPLAPEAKGDSAGIDAKLPIYSRNAPLKVFVAEGSWNDEAEQLPPCFPWIGDGPGGFSRPRR